MPSKDVLQSEVEAKTGVKTVFSITEGVESTWHYHLSLWVRSGDALIGQPDVIAMCGARVMPTSIPLKDWDTTPANYHIYETWCKDCHRLRQEHDS